MINLKDKVEIALKDDPNTRDSDITLMIYIWKRWHAVEDSVLLTRLYFLPREDNIKRIRAKFCSEGKEWAYPTIWEIAKRRGILENIWRKVLGYPSRESTLNPTREPSYTTRENPFKQKEKLFD